MSKARLQVFSEGIFYSKIKYCMQVYGNVFNLERYKETGSRYSSFTVSANNDLQILQNKLNRIIINSRGTRAMSTRELCEMTKTLSVLQMIAVSTLSTALKILRTGKPSYLFSKFGMNDRKTALVQKTRKCLSSEGFVSRAVSLVNRMGISILDEGSGRVEKGRIQEWVLANINVKPKPSVKSLRFGGKVNQIGGNEVEPVQGQQRIMDYFVRH